MPVLEDEDQVDHPNDRDCLEDDYQQRLSLKSEKARLLSFHHFPVISVQPEELARWGFYSLHSGDKVKCIFCGVVLKSWEPGDIVEDEHRKFSPTCPFLCGQNVGNIPIDKKSKQISPRNFYLSSHTKQLQVPKHPEYGLPEIRLETFSNWPKDIHQTPKELVEAGFYYTGSEDSVNCFYCGGNLRNWEKDDNIWLEHRRWFPQCEFARTNHQLKNAFERQPLFQEALSLGCDEELVKRVMEEKQRKGGEFEDINLLLDELNKFKVQQETHQAPKKLEHLSPENLTRGIISGAAAALSSGLVTSATSGASTSYVENEYRQVPDQLVCKICMNQPVAVTFFPCGHLVTCIACSQKVQKCPICRVKIKAAIRTFLS
ncbi:hypothetical protein ACJMK2_027802 [Sinanodonta woodiana]|uniref:RING-type domain-containing protein n=1 Tax=Sinanodonta woodiana TaxID=1069815 RepID=A0ABD3X5M8_SINWO